MAGEGEKRRRYGGRQPVPPTGGLWTRKPEGGGMAGGPGASGEILNFPSTHHAHGRRWQLRAVKESAVIDREGKNIHEEHMGKYYYWFAPMNPDTGEVTEAPRHSREWYDTPEEALHAGRRQITDLSKSPEERQHYGIEE